MIKHKKLFAFLLAGVMAFSLAACKPEEQASSSSSSEPEILVDPNYPVAIGEIRIAERPETIVSLSPAITEILVGLGAGDRLEGVSDFCDYPSSIENLSRCGSSSSPNLKEIKKLRPQVVFSSVSLSQADTIALQQLGAEVVVLGRAATMDDLEEVYLTAATIMDGKEDGKADGEAYFARLRARYDALCTAADGIADRLGGIYLRMEPLTMATGDTFEHEILTKALGINNAAEAYTGWVYPEDKAVDLYPDIIFHDQSIDPAFFKETKVYSTTDAVKNERYYVFNALAIERQSPRMFDVLEEMFAEAYPDVTVPEPQVADEPDDESTSADAANSDETSSEETSSDDGMLDLDDATSIVEKN